MTKAEVDECLRFYTDKYEITYEQNPHKFHVSGAIKSCFQLEYDPNGKVNFIQISSVLNDVLKCVFKNIDVFNTKAEELVKEIDKISKYDRDHWELGWTYDYPELGPTVFRTSFFGNIVCTSLNLGEMVN
ncbi:hypothetical protein [Paenibacillus harenae]|uniref:hypothetical protein n=1 Tax=Paenibacillus harenae TaxID=306543 RepID=UPI0006884C53|nr:hypothetical protein [Paenibacillus harenae]